MRPFEVPWELRGRGLSDARRHDQRVREAVLQQLPRIITEETIISSKGRRLIRIPIRYLEQYRFRYAGPEPAATGAGRGVAQSGDPLAEPQAGGMRPGDLPGDQPGLPVYEATFTLDALTRMMLEQFELPWLERKPQPRQRIGAEDWSDLRRHGRLQQLDKRRTLYEHVKRRAASAQRGIGVLHESDLRFRIRREREQAQAQAAIYMLMDRSGSMTTEKRYIAKCFFFWLVQFLRLKYRTVDLVFIAHDAVAETVDEHAFFTLSSSGGTRCSSAYALCLQHIRAEHPPSHWNNYVFHLSDGDNLPDDNPAAVAGIKRLLACCRLVGFGEIRFPGRFAFFGPVPPPQRAVRSPLLQHLLEIDHPALLSFRLQHRRDVYQALAHFLRAEGGRT